LGSQSHSDLAPGGAAVHNPASKNHDINIATLPVRLADSASNIARWPHKSSHATQVPRPELATRRRHILLLTADGDPGGGVTNVLQLCRALKKDGGWHVTLCSQTRSYAIQQARTICDEVHEIDFFTSRFDPRVTWKLRRLIRSLSPDLIHTHGSRAALPVSYALGRNGSPLINTVHGFHFYQKSTPARVLAIKAERSIMRRADKTVFVCNNDESIADQEGIAPKTQSAITIHHGIEIRNLPKKQSHPLPTIVMLGRLVPQKHPQMLIEIADLHRDSRYNFQFIGGGPLEAELKAEVARRGLGDIVQFLGEHSREDALQLAARADLAVLPSRWEGFPIALLELLGMGIPVIASSVNGIPEAIQDGWNGFLVEERNARMYAERMRWLIQNPAMRSAFGRNARNSVADRFSETRMTAEHLALYRKTIAARTKSAAVPCITSE
jgi:glycosyltransferase involved in cell wall biosynthesis